MTAPVRRPRLNLRGKLALAFGLQLALVAGVAAAGLLGLRSVQRSFETAIQQGLTSERLAVELRSELGEARRAEKDFLLTWRSDGFEQAERHHVAVNLRHLARIRAIMAELEAANAAGGPAFPPRPTTEDLVALKPYVDVYAEDFAATVALIGERAHREPALDRHFRELVAALLAAVRESVAFQPVSASLIQLRQHERDFVFRGEWSAREPVRATAARLRAQLGALPADARATSERLIARYLAAFEEVETTEGRIRAKSADFQAAAVVVEPLVRDIALVGQQEAAALIARAQAAAGRTTLIVGASLVAAMITGLLLAYALGQQVTAPLGALARASLAVTAGDLTARAEVSSRDEIGTLAATFNAMTVKLHELVRSLEERVLERERAEEEVRRLNAELEQRVRDRTAELEAANRELEAFSYSVSHDLRTPLRHIGGFVYLLRQHEQPLEEQGREHLDTIAAAVRRMGGLIDALLAFSRIGRAELRTEAIALEPLVDEARAELADDGKNREVTWVVGALPRVRGDRALLRQVMVNLLSNALKFTRPRPRAEIEIRAAPEQAGHGEAVFLVRDNGVGFDMAYADKLFGVFKRLHATEAFEGTGIGLANVERIVRRHGGRVWAQAAVEAGATFFVALPSHSDG